MERARDPRNSAVADRPLRILRVASDLYPEVVGGLGLHTYHLSRRQAEMGHEVTLLTTNHDHERLPRFERTEGFTIYRYPELVSPLDNSIAPGLGVRLWKIADEYDVIHAHSHLYFSTNLAAVVSRLKGDLPLFITNHGLFSQTASPLVQKLYIPTVGRFTFNSADRIFCYTSTDEQRLRELGVRSPVSVVTNGIDCDLFSPDEEVESRPQILYVGRLKRGKGVGTLLRAFARIAPDFPDYRLRIIGDGPRRGTLGGLARRLGIRDRVTFVQYVPNEEMPREYNRSAVFALPSGAEGFPRTVLEAMACGLPIVTTRLPQLERVVDGAGRTVSPNDATELADAIGDLLDADDRREMGEIGREKVVSEYAWEDTVRETTWQYYHEIDGGL